MAGFRIDADVSPIIASCLISGIGFIISVGTSMFISGTKWGAMQQKVNTIETQTKDVASMNTDLAVVKHDLAEIKGMFTMKIKDGL